MISIRKLRPGLEEKSKIELNEDPLLIEENLKKFKLLINNEHLNLFNDQFILLFLRSSKYNFDKALNKVNRIRMLIPNFPELFKNRNVNDPEIIELIKLGITIVLPKTLGVNGPRVFLLRLGIFDPNKFNYEQIFKTNIMISEITVIEDDNIAISGQINIYDMSNVTLSHLTKFNPKFFFKLITTSQEGFPIRVKGYHFFNSPPFIVKVLKFLKSCFNEKMQKRFYIHGSDPKELHKNIPKEILPKEYDGDDGPIDNIIDDLVKKLPEYKEYFDKLSNAFDAIENQRDCCNFNNDLFGVEGTFKKLNVD